MFYFSDGNSKLKKTGKSIGKRIFSFNLPAGRSATGRVVCPFAGSCAEYCYAKQGAYKWTPAIEVRESNLEMLHKHRENHLSVMLEDSIPSQADIVRIHDSGDFFAKWYASAWLDAIRNTPTVHFYAYTKSWRLFDLSDLPSNFVLVQSAGSADDSLLDKRHPHAVVFRSHEDRELAGYVNGNEDDSPAIRGENKIGLVYHGTKRMPSVIPAVAVPQQQ